MVSLTEDAGGIDVTFSGAVDPATFTVADLTDPATGFSRVTDPSGNPLAVSAVNQIADNLYQIVLVNSITAPGFLL